MTAAAEFAALALMWSAIFAGFWFLAGVMP
jgi:hypothetical protein